MSRPESRALSIDRVLRDVANMPSYEAIKKNVSIFQMIIRTRYPDLIDDVKSFSDEPRSIKKAFSVLQKIRHVLWYALDSGKVVLHGTSPDQQAKQVNCLAHIIFEHYIHNGLNEMKMTTNVMLHRKYCTTWKVGAFITNKGRTQFLATSLRYADNRLGFVKGAVESGESYIDSLIREVYEETLIVVEEGNVKQFFVRACNNDVVRYYLVVLDVKDLNIYNNNRGISEKETSSVAVLPISCLNNNYMQKEFIQVFHDMAPQFISLLKCWA